MTMLNKDLPRPQLMRQVEAELPQGALQVQGKTRRNSPKYCTPAKGLGITRSVRTGWIHLGAAN
jgi:hypothetical protein